MPRLQTISSILRNRHQRAGDIRKLSEYLASSRAGGAIVLALKDGVLCLPGLGEVSHDNGAIVFPARRKISRF